MTTDLTGDITIFLSVLGTEYGSNALLDAFLLAGVPAGAGGFVRDDGTTSDYLASEETGVEYSFINGTLSAIFIYTQNDGTHTAYPRPDTLIVGLPATATRDETRALLGEPERSMPVADRFGVGERFLHFTYGDDGRTTMLTVMATAP